MKTNLRTNNFLLNLFTKSVKEVFFIRKFRTILFSLIQITVVMFSFMMLACEEEVKLDLPDGKGKIVVEGHIEQNLPPYVILTKTVSFTSNLNVSQYENLFVHNAVITVSDGTNSVQLQEYCANDLDNSVKYFLSEYLGISSLDTNLQLNFCLYTIDTSSFFFKGEIGKQYDIMIKSGDDVITSSTSIPYQLTLDSLWYEEGVNQENDSLVLLWARYTDPDTFGNYVRYFTSTNGEQFLPGYFGSVFDDRFVNGTSFPFTIDKGISKGQQPDFSNYGYFYKGDTIIVKWCAIDAAHYNFWQTAEQAFGNSGNPFGTPTVIISNVKGGVGVWGAYSAFYDTLIVPK